MIACEVVPGANTHSLTFIATYSSYFDLSLFDTCFILLYYDTYACNFVSVRPILCSVIVVKQFLKVPFYDNSGKLHYHCYLTRAPRTKTIKTKKTGLFRKRKHAKPTKFAVFNLRDTRGLQLGLQLEYYYISLQ